MRIQTLESDLEKQFEFLNEKNPDVASRATRAILNAGASLANSPERGTLIPNSDQNNGSSDRLDRIEQLLKSFITASITERQSSDERMT